MKLHKRPGSAQYWADFTIEGQRFRVSLRTKDWREAQKRAKQAIVDASAGKLKPKQKDVTRLMFAEAVDWYLESRRYELSEGSFIKERQMLARPKEFFKARLNQIQNEHLRGYIPWRLKTGVSNNMVNMELFGPVRRLLTRAGRWHFIAGDLRPLKVKQHVGRALSDDHKEQLLRTAASRPEWFIAHLAARVALNTTARGGELKGIRWQDVDFEKDLMFIRRSKTDAGERVIPLNSEAKEALLLLNKRASALGTVYPEHYVFGACEHGRFDPSRPMKSWRTAWRRLTRAVSCPDCGFLQQPTSSCRKEECKSDMRDVRSTLAGLRFHDLRHSSITELAESHASDQTIMAIAGHVSPRMLRHYSHVRIAAMRTALNGLVRQSNTSHK
jgi:integrase